MRKLCDVEIGETVTVISLEAVSYFKERLLSLGLKPNASVQVVRKGQRENLTVYNVDYRVKIALRREESKFINVT
ncbi:FeoA family protein [Haloplasma contractile]|uniref:Ferrous iron transport protein A n=1 Tax=Haloplasma contractile SSD-17B TaxID=1033810 RepID=U2FMD1_9MOLU|nr:FeoA family protein [Haloplasma contractile]ERJ12329.1 Ferrous iron transport protein A [Haloplasma contractile SSD-17B]